MDVQLPSKRTQFRIGKIFISIRCGHKIAVIISVKAYYVTLVPTGLNLLLYIIDTIIIHRKYIEFGELLIIISVISCRYYYY